MSDRIRISVIVAAYNQASYLAQALDSLLEQDVDASLVEILVINDGSTDETPSVLGRYRDRLTVLEQNNTGLVATCNRGLALARGRYVARLDADDYAAPGWLRRTMETLEASPHACCVFPDHVEVTAESQRRISLAGANLYELIACGTLFATDAVRRAGGFRPMYWEEYDLYLRLREHGAFLHVDEPLYFYRKHAASMTADPGRRRAGWLELIDLWGPTELLRAGTCAELSAAIGAR